MTIPPAITRQRQAFAHLQAGQALAVTPEGMVPIAPVKVDKRTRQYRLEHPRKPKVSAASVILAADADEDAILASARRELERLGPITAQERIEIASMWARSPDPAVALGWSKFLAALEMQGGESAGAPNYKSPRAQIEDLSAMMGYLGEDATNDALLMAFPHWGSPGHVIGGDEGMNDAPAEVDDGGIRESPDGMESEGGRDGGTDSDGSTTQSEPDVPIEPDPVPEAPPPGASRIEWDADDFFKSEYRRRNLTDDPEELPDE